jgi:hypothetical protein
MKIQRIADNVTEVTDTYTGNKVLISYNTPVAIAHIDGMVEVPIKHISNTTSKHINAWLKAQNVVELHHKPIHYFAKYMGAL